MNTHGDAADTIWRNVWRFRGGTGRIQCQIRGLRVGASDEEGQSGFRVHFVAFRNDNITHPEARNPTRGRPLRHKGSSWRSGQVGGTPMVHGSNASVIESTRRRFYLCLLYYLPVNFNIAECVRAERTTQTLAQRNGSAFLTDPSGRVPWDNAFMKT